jgi:hypothetical protein
MRLFLEMRDVKFLLKRDQTNFIEWEKEERQNDIFLTFYT